MPPVFNRYLPDPHPYDEALEEWRRLSTDPIERTRDCARVCNLRYDHRVSYLRAEAFDGFVNRPISAATLRRGLERYFAERIRVLADPDFVDDRLNDNNFVLRIDKDVKLARVLDLNGLLKPLQLAMKHRRRGRSKTTLGFSRVPALDDRSFADWLDDKLGKGVQFSKVGQAAFRSCCDRSRQRPLKRSARKLAI